MVFRFGEAPRAYIVLKSGESLSKNELDKYMSENAAPYKHLVGGIEFIEAIPKSAAGKILRKELVARYKEGLKLDEVSGQYTSTASENDVSQDSILRFP